MKEEKKWGIILIGSLVLFMACVMLSAILPRDLQKQQAANEATISGLEASLEQSDGEPADGKTEEGMTQEEETKALKSATDAGNKVAEYQNAYRDLSARDDREAFDANVNALDALLSENAKNARVPWYQSDLAGTWSFVTDGEFSGDTLGVLWLCQTEDGKFCAYATGTYEAGTGTFSNIQYRMTTEAADNMPFENNGQTDDGTNLTVDDLQDTIDKINDVDTSDIPDEAGTDEERAQNEEARWKLKEQMTGGGE